MMRKKVSKQDWPMGWSGLLTAGFACRTYVTRRQPKLVR